MTSPVGNAFTPDGHWCQRAPPGLAGRRQRHARPPRGRMPNAKDNLSKKFGQAAVMRGIAYDGSKTARVTRPSHHRISRFSGAQLRTMVRCFATPRNDGQKRPKAEWLSAVTCRASNPSRRICRARRKLRNHCSRARAHGRRHSRTARMTSHRPGSARRPWSWHRDRNSSP